MSTRPFVSACAMLAACSTASADFVVQPIGVTATNTWSDFARPELIINGEGTAGWWTELVHGRPIPQPWPGHSIWWNNGHYITYPTTPGRAILPTLDFDLGATYSLQGMHFWNCNLADLQWWGVRTAVVSTSVDGVNFTPQQLGGLAADGTFPQGSGWPEYAYRGETYGLQTRARFIRLTVTSNWGGECTSIAEVRFIGRECDSIVISEQPESQAACIGAPTALSLVTSGTTPESHQWRFEQSPIDPALNPTASTGTLIISSVTAADAGNYDCVVVNACSQITSNPATLSICPGDFNCDGGVDGSDIDAFFPEWEGGNAIADINADGGVDGADVSAFFNRWESGC